jgi:hypothetical protein
VLGSLSSHNALKCSSNLPYVPNFSKPIKNDLFLFIQVKMHATFIRFLFSPKKPPCNERERESNR